MVLESFISPIKAENRPWTMLFLGFIFLYIFLPPDLVKLLFSSQLDTIDSINSRVSGKAIDTTNIFAQIFLNNIKVLMFCIFFAFFYGAGAIFILAWNASVISAAIGTF